MSTLRLNIPTVLTLSRIVLIPFFVISINHHPILGAFVFGVASLTDFLDGYLARRSGQITKFGIIMDPIADKFLIITALVVLVDMNWLSSWIAIIIIVREFLVTTLRVVALSKDIIIQAEIGGKLKMTTQITGIICLILPRDFLGIDLWGLDVKDIGSDIMVVSLVLAVISGFQYTVAFWKRI